MAGALNPISNRSVDLYAVWLFLVVFQLICAFRNLRATRVMAQDINISQLPSTYHVNIGSVDLTIRLDVLSGACPTCAEMVEKSPIFDPNLKEQQLSNHNQTSKLKLQERA